jgi:hypothetical protein
MEDHREERSALTLDDEPGVKFQKQLDFYFLKKESVVVERTYLLPSVDFCPQQSGLSLGCVRSHWEIGLGQIQCISILVGCRGI